MAGLSAAYQSPWAACLLGRLRFGNETTVGIPAVGLSIRRLVIPVRLHPRRMIEVGPQLLIGLLIVPTALTTSRRWILTSPFESRPRRLIEEKRRPAKQNLLRRLCMRLRVSRPGRSLARRRGLTALRAGAVMIRIETDERRRRWRK